MNGTYQNIDCMELMANLKDKSIDLAIVDPEYGIDVMHSGGMPKHLGFKQHTRKDWDKKKSDKYYFSELFRVSKNQIIFGANYYTEYLPPSMGWILWDKGQRLSQSDGELAFTSFDKALRVFTLNRCFIKMDGSIHPTQKPVKLYEWLLTNYAKPNDLILDTHCGSASSLIACENLGFKYIASELDKDYYYQSLQRIETHLAQGKLFQRVGGDKIESIQPAMFA